MERTEVAVFLAARHRQVVESLEPLGGGAWSSAWAYRAGGRELVVRFGPERAWYEADRSATAFAGPDLPVPEVLEIGAAPGGGAFAISARHRGRFLEDTPVDAAPTLAATLTRLLVALKETRAPSTDVVVWHQPDSTLRSWRAFLLAGLVDHPDPLVHGWSDALAADPELSPLADAVAARIRRLVDACPERRDLPHGDLLHGNVLLDPNADRVEAVFSWKCSVLGDFLFDTAWCSFWSSFHPGIAAADPLGGILAAQAVQADSTALIDAASRHHCYELHIGFTHLGWNFWTGNEQALRATAARLSAVYERGPLGLALAAGGVQLVVVTDEVLEALVALAIAEAQPGEVTPPLSSSGTWTAERIAWLRSFHLDRRPGLAGPRREATWAVVAGERIVGSVRLRANEPQGWVEVGAWLGRSARGVGVGRAALLALLDEARKLGVREVRAETTATNNAAIAVLSRVGFLVEAASESVHAQLRLPPG